MKETQIQMREKREESPSHEGVMNARGLKRTLAKEEPEGSPAWRGQCGTKAKVLVAQSCPTLCDPLDCSPPGSSVHGIFQARILK